MEYCRDKIDFMTSLFVAYYSDIYSADEFLNSALTVLIGFISSKVIFVILFHLDHKKKYTKRFTGKLNLDILKQVLMKMIFADSIFDIINNVSRFFILLELLKINYQPIQAALIASIVASALSYLAINLIVRQIHVFGGKKKSCNFFDTEFRSSFEHLTGLPKVAMKNPISNV